MESSDSMGIIQLIDSQRGERVVFLALPNLCTFKLGENEDNQHLYSLYNTGPQPSAKLSIGRRLLAHGPDSVTKSIHPLTHTYNPPSRKHGLGHYVHHGGFQKYCDAVASAEGFCGLIPQRQLSLGPS